MGREYKLMKQLKYIWNNQERNTLKLIRTEREGERDTFIS